MAIPRLRNSGDIEDVPVSVHDDRDVYRYPHVLRFSFGGTTHEVVGAHAKGKFTASTPRGRKSDETFEEYAKLKTVKRYLAKSHAAHITLS